MPAVSSSFLRMENRWPVTALGKHEAFHRFFRLHDSFPERRHAIREDRFRILVRAAQIERIEVLVPVAVWRGGFGLDPLLQPS